VGCVGNVVGAQAVACNHVYVCGKAEVQAEHAKRWLSERVLGQELHMGTA